MFDSVLTGGNVPQRRLGTGAIVSIAAHALIEAHEGLAQVHEKAGRTAEAVTAANAALAVAAAANSAGRKLIFNSTVKKNEFRVRESGFLAIVGRLWIRLDSDLTKNDSNHTVAEATAAGTKALSLVYAKPGASYYFAQKAIQGIKLGNIEVNSSTFNPLETEKLLKALGLDIRIPQTPQTNVQKQTESFTASPRRGAGSGRPERATRRRGDAATAPRGRHTEHSGHCGQARFPAPHGWRRPAHLGASR